MNKKNKKSPSDIQEQVGALKALSAIHRLLNQAALPIAAMPDVHRSLEFVTALHSKVAAEALEHPDAASIPELSSLREKSKQQPSQETN